MPDLMDLDRAVADYCARHVIPEPTGIEARMTLHLEAITRWLEQTAAGGKAPASEHTGASL